MVIRINLLVTFVRLMPDALFDNLITETVVPCSPWSNAPMSIAVSKFHIAHVQFEFPNVRFEKDV